MDNQKAIQKITSWFLIAAFLTFQIFPANGLAFDAANTTVVEGNVTIDTADPNNINITNNAASSIIDVAGSGFNIGNGQTINVNQLMGSQLLIRDISGNVTEIAGTLNVIMGLLVLVNTYGIHVDSTGVINIAAGADLIASTLNIQNQLFMNNNLTFEQLNGTDFAKIINEGEITAEGMARIALLSDAIENTGTIEVQSGEVVLAGVERATVDLSGSGLINLVVDKGVTDNQSQPVITNTGELHADGGKITLTAEMLNNTLDTLINSTGIVEAGTAAIGEEGTVEIRANGAVDITSVLEAMDVTVEALGNSQIGSVTVKNLTLAGYENGQVTYDVKPSSQMNLNGSMTIEQNTTVNANDAQIQVKGNWTSNGTFNGQNSTVMFNGGSIPDPLNPGQSKVPKLDVSATDRFNDLIIDKSDGYSMDIAQGDTVIVEGTLALQDGRLGNVKGGVVEARGNVTVDSDFDGGSSILRIASPITLNLLNDRLMGLHIEHPDAIVNLPTTPTYSFGNDLKIIDGNHFHYDSDHLNINGAFRLLGGDFVAPSNNLTITGDFQIAPGAEFDHNLGTVIFTGTEPHVIDVDQIETFHNLTFSSPGGYAYRLSGDTLETTGTLTLIGGQLDEGTIRAYNDVQHQGPFNGGNATIEIVPDDPNNPSARPSTINLRNGNLPNLVVNDSRVTVNGNNSGTLYFGTRDPQTGEYRYGNVTVQAGNFLGSTGDINLADVTIEGGEFQAPTNNLFMRGRFTHTTSTGIFDHNNGTVHFIGNPTSPAIDVNQREVFNNLVIAKDHPSWGSNYQFLIGSGDIIQVNGDLDIMESSDYTTLFINGGTFEAHGDVMMGSALRGGSTNLTFAGSNDQTYTALTGSDELNGTYTINKTGGKVLLESAMNLDGNGQDLTVASGTLDINGKDLNVKDKFTVASDGTLRLQGGENVTTGSTDFATGSDAVYYGMDNYTLLGKLAAGNNYYNLTFASMNGGDWATGSNAVMVRGDLTIDGSDSTVDASQATLLDIDGSYTQNGSTTFYAPTQGRVMKLGGDFNVMNGLYHSGTGKFIFDGTGAEQRVRRGGDAQATDEDRYKGSFFYDLEISGTAEVIADSNIPYDSFRVKNDFTLNSGGLDLNNFDFEVKGDVNIHGGFLEAKKGTQRFNEGHGSFNMTGGTYIGWDSSMGPVTGNDGETWMVNFYQSGGNFIASEKQLQVRGDFVRTGGTFDHNDGHVVLQEYAGGTSVLNPGDTVFNDLTIADGPAHTRTLAGNKLEIAGNFTKGHFNVTGYQGPTNLPLGSGIFNTGDQEVHVEGQAIIFSGTYQGGTAKQTFDSGLILTGETGDAYGRINAGTGEIEVNGDFLVGGVGDVNIDGQNFNLGNFGRLTGNSTTGIIDVNGNFTHTSAQLLTLPRSNMYVSGNFDRSAGTLAHNNGTLVLDGNQNSTFNSGGTGTNHQYNNIQVDKINSEAQMVTNDVDAVGTLTVNSGSFDQNQLDATLGGLTVNGGLYEGSTGATDVNGNVNLTGGELSATTGDFTVSGDWTNTGGVFRHNNATVTLDGAAGTTQNLNSGRRDFYDLTHTGDSTVQVMGNPLTVANNLTNSAGLFDINGQSINVKGLTTVDGGELRVPSGLDEFGDGGATDGILVRNGGKFTGGEGLMRVRGNVTIEEGGEFVAPYNDDLFPELYVSGNWRNAGIFDHNDGEIFLNGTGTQILDAGNSSFHHLAVTGGGTVELENSDLNVDRTLEVRNGTVKTNGLNTNVVSALQISDSAAGSVGIFDAGTGTHNFGFLLVGGNGSATFLGRDAHINAGAVYIVPSAGTALLSAPSANGSFNVSGNWLQFGGTFQHNGGTVNFNGSGHQQFSVGTPGTGNFYNLEHSGTGTLFLSNNPLTVENNFTNSAGTYNSGGMPTTVLGTAEVSGGNYVASSGTQTFGDGDAGDGLIISNTGTFTAASGNINIDGDYTQTDGNFIGGSGTLDITQQFTQTGGTFEQNDESIVVGPAGDNANAGRETFNMDGGTFNGSMTGASIDINGDFEQTGGDFTSTNGTMTISGNFERADGGEATIDNPYYNPDDPKSPEQITIKTSAGTFDPNGGEVEFDAKDPNGPTYQTITGSTRFHRFTKQANSPDYLIFESGSLTEVEGQTTLRGSGPSPEQLLYIRASIPGQEAYFAPAYLPEGGIDRNISMVNVQDNHNLIRPVIFPTDQDVIDNSAVDSGGTTNWFPERQDDPTCQTNCDDPTIIPDPNEKLSQDITPEDTLMVCESILNKKDGSDIEEAQVFMVHPDGTMELLGKSKEEVEALKNNLDKNQQAEIKEIEPDQFIRCMQVQHDQEITSEANLEA